MARRVVSARTRDRIPKPKTNTAASTASTGTSQLLGDFRGLVGRRASLSFSTSSSVCITGFTILSIQRLRFDQGLFCLVAMQHAEKCRNEEQCGDGCKNKATNHGASQRRILLTTVSEAQCHR